MSFDIGIKTMAYCVLSSKVGESDMLDATLSSTLQMGALGHPKGEVEPDVLLSRCSDLSRLQSGEKTLNTFESELSILDWQVIDISTVEEKEITLYCSYCKKKAKYEKNGNNYCQKHAQSSEDGIIRLKNMEKSNINKMKLNDVFELGIKHKILNLDDKKILKKTMVDKIDDFFLEKCYKMIITKKQNASDINLITLGRNMKQILNTIPYIDKITHVIIENQISPLASRMKTIQGMLAQYFIMKFDNTIHISFVSSSNKLKLFPMNKNIESDEKKKYKQHKSDAIHHVKQILEKNKSLHSWLNLFNDSNSTKKLDDLSDGLLQGIWFLNHIKFITINDTYILTKNNNQ
jgi:hypothetical protein